MTRAIIYSVLVLVPTIGVLWAGWKRIPFRAWIHWSDPKGLARKRTPR